MFIHSLENFKNIIFFIGSISLTWTITAKLLPFFRKNLLDHPNLRSSHKNPTPRGGGIIFVFTFLLFCSIKLILSGWDDIFYIPFLSLPLAFLGFIDDKMEVSSLVRYITQIITSFGILRLSPIYEILNLNSLSYLIIPIVISITAIINFVNFMDGIDGLVCGYMCVLFINSSIYINNIFWPLSGALLGFIIWNWSPAKIFMGDIGSTYLGAIFAGSLLYSNNNPETLNLLLISAPLLSDAFICVIRRFISGQNIFRPHKLHLYQRLTQNGWSHKNVSIIYITSALILSIAVHTNIFIGLVIYFSILSFGIYLDYYKAVPFYES